MSLQVTDYGVTRYNSSQAIDRTHQPYYRSLLEHVDLGLENNKHVKLLGDLNLSVLCLL